MSRKFGLWTLVLLISQLAYTGHSLANASPANSPAGKWTGKLDVGGTVLRIVFNISQDDQGDYSATLDSPDQGASGIPVGEVAYSDNEITLSVTAIAGKYVGVLSEDGQTLNGTWSQGGGSWTLNLKKGDSGEEGPTKSTAGEIMKDKDIQRLSGRWLGTLKLANISLRIVFNLSGTPEKRLAASIDSPDQGAKGIPVSSLGFENNHLKMEVASVGGFFEGDVAEDNLSIDGNWMQGGVSRPLSLAKIGDDTKIQGPRRPQEPQKPYPYQEEEVTYPNEKAGITLAGTLTLPKGKGPFPAVILISGSGPQDRNETLMGHKPFLVWADHLTRQGIAVLRFDDRGFGKSTGDFSSATSLDFVTDVHAGVAYLKARPEIDASNIGLIGHSEGGLIAPIAAVESKDIAFIVLMAGPGITGAEVLRTQQLAMLKTNGLSPETSRAMQELNKRLFEIVQSEKDNEVALKKLRDYSQQTWASLDSNIVAELRSVGENGINETMLRQLTSPWFRYFLNHNPQKWLEQVKCPVLVLNGEKDVQVTPKENLQAIEAAFMKAGKKNYTLKELPGLNHLFQEAKTGAPLEYSQIEATVSPEVLKILSDWIKNTTS